MQEVLTVELDYKLASEIDIKNWNDVKIRLQAIIVAQKEIYDIMGKEDSMDYLLEKINDKQLKAKQIQIYNSLYEIYFETSTIFTFNADGTKTTTAAFWKPITVKLKEFF